MTDEYEHNYDYLVVEVHQSEDSDTWMASVMTAQMDPIEADTYRDALVGMAERISTAREERYENLAGGSDE